MLLVLILCAVPMAGYVVVEAAGGIRTAEPPASNDVETPRGPARPAAPMGRSAQQPADVGTTASPASAGRTAAKNESRCGADQAPVYETPHSDREDGSIALGMPVPDPDGVLRHFPGEIKPADVGYTGAMRRLDASLRSDGDPFDGAVADWLDLGQLTPPDSRTVELVQDALAVDDARVYGLAYADCHSPTRSTEDGASAPAVCARLSATRWAQLDPGNAAPWLWVLDDADQRGDAVARRDALQHVAAASRMEIHYYAEAAAVARVPTDDADLAAQVSATIQAMAISAPPALSLAHGCAGGEAGDLELASTCSRIAELFYERSDSLLWRAIGASLHKRMSGDASWSDLVHREPPPTASAPAAEPAGPCSAERRMLRHFVQLDQVGEVKLGQRQEPASDAR